MLTVVKHMVAMTSRVAIPKNLFQSVVSKYHNGENKHKSSMPTRPASASFYKNEAKHKGELARKKAKNAITVSLPICQGEKSHPILWFR